MEVKTKEDQPQRQIKSSVVIARLLHSQGFDDHVAHQTYNYWKNTAGFTERQKKRLNDLHLEWGKIANEKLTIGDRLVLGRFMGLKIRAAFDTAMKIGMMTGLSAEDVYLDKDL